MRPILPVLLVALSTLMLTSAWAQAPAQATLTCTQSAVPAVNPVPTLGEWARLLLGVLVLLVAGGVLARRQRLA